MPVQSSETEAPGWFMFTRAMAVLSSGLLGRKGRGTRQGEATVVDAFRSHNLDLLGKPPGGSLGRIQGMLCVSTLLLVITHRLELLG